MNINCLLPILFASMGVSSVMAASIPHGGHVSTAVEQSDDAGHTMKQSSHAAEHTIAQHRSDNTATLADNRKQDKRSSQDRDSGRIIPQFVLQNGAGEVVSDADFADRYLLVSFGFTHCPHTCPTILSNWATVMTALPEAMAERLVPILISVDPERDTPQVMENYVRQFDERFVGLSGSAEQVAAAAKNFRVAYRKVGDGSHYMIQHTGFSYLISPQREVMVIFRSSTRPERMAPAIRTLLK